MRGCIMGRPSDALLLVLPPLQVWVKVLSVLQEGGRDARVSCSMRAVNQEDGTDLDPDNALAAGVRVGGNGDLAACPAPRALLALCAAMHECSSTGHHPKHQR